MAGNVVGTGVIIIGADASDFDKDLQRQTDKASKSAGEKSGSTFGANFAANLASQGVQRAVSGVASTIGLGFSTAMESEVAAMKFSQLFKGQTDKAASFISDLKAFAARTPFDFPGLQESAGKFLAVGIEASRVIPIMTNLGNITSLMGTGSEGIQRATLALQQMATRGKVTGEELMQLTEAGIPAMKLLSESMGVPTGELQKMVEKGLVPADKMFAALEQTSSGTMQTFNGGMEKMATTTEGKLSTLRDNFSQFAGRLVDKLLPSMSGLIDFVSEKAIPAIEGFATALSENLGPVFTDIGDKIRGLNEWFREHEGVAKALGVTLGVVFGLIAAAWVQVGVQATIAAAQNVAAWLSVAVSGQAAGTATRLSIMQQVAHWAILGVQAMLHAAKVAAAWLIAMGPIGLIIAAVVGLVAIIILNLDTIKSWISSAWDWITEKTYAIWNGIWSFFEERWEGIKTIFTQAVEVIKGHLSAAWEWIKSAAATAWEVIKWVILGPVGAIARLIWENWETIKQWLADAWGAIEQHAENVWYGIQRFFWERWNTIRQIFTDAVDTVKRVVSDAWNSVRDTAVGAWARVRDVITGAWEAIKSGVSERIGTVVQFVAELPGRAIAALGNVRDLLLQKGKDVIEGFFDGLKSVWDTVVGWLKSLGGIIKSVKGPMSVDRSLLKPEGAAIMKGFEEGIKSGQDPIMKNLIGFTGAIGKVVAGRVNIGGKLLDTDTYARITAALGNSYRLNQGSWSRGVAASMGTHDGAGVADITPLGLGWAQAVNALNAAGLRAIFRNWPGNQHIHLLNPNVSGHSPAAARQLQGEFSFARFIRTLPSSFRGYAAGTMSAAPGWGLVGERGPEWIRFRGGETVLPNGQTPSGIVVNMAVSVDDLAKMSKIGDFLTMVERSRLEQRRTARSGAVA